MHEDSTESSLKALEICRGGREICFTAQDASNPGCVRLPFRSLGQDMERTTGLEAVNLDLDQRDLTEGLEAGGVADWWPE